MTGTIKFKFNESSMSIECDVRNVDSVDIMMALHGMKKALKVPETLWKQYVIMEHMGMLEPDKAVHIDTESVADAFLHMKEQSDEG